MKHSKILTSTCLAGFAAFMLMATASYEANAAMAPAVATVDTTILYPVTPAQPTLNGAVTPMPMAVSTDCYKLYKGDGNTAAQKACPGVVGDKNLNLVCLPNKAGTLVWECCSTNPDGSSTCKQVYPPVVAPIIPTKPVAPAPVGPAKPIKQGSDTDS